MKLLKLKTKYQQGFTLIETFVAILILVLAVIGPLGLLSRAISDGNYAKNQITAHFLAQEAAEYVIYQRNQNLLSGNDWLFGLDDCLNSTCKIDTYNENISACSLDSNCLLYVDDFGGYKKYTHFQTSEPSIFQRQVEIISDGVDSQEAKVFVTVRWTNKNTPSTFVLPIVLYNRNYISPQP